MKKVGMSRKGLYLLFSILACFLMVGCGNNLNNSDELVINAGEFELHYGGNIKLLSVPLKADDLSEIVWLYQEDGDNVGYRDSLLIAQKYSQGLGINAFVQENLDVLEDNGLTLSNIKKKQIFIEKEGKEINAVLAEYEIVEGFVEEIPILYASQFFIPDGNYVWLMSFITENQSSRNSMSNAFKQIK